MPGTGRDDERMTVSADLTLDGRSVRVSVEAGGRQDRWINLDPDSADAAGNRLHELAAQARANAAARTGKAPGTVNATDPPARKPADVTNPLPQTAA